MAILKKSRRLGQHQLKAQSLKEKTPWARLPAFSVELPAAFM
jgi:hypothetical protein